MAMAATSAVALPEAEHSAQLRKAVVASTIGTAIEWYDFFLYGTAAGLVFGKLYFPEFRCRWRRRCSPSVPISSASSAGPIGAAIFGHYGDRIGRKATLIATLLCMGLATFAIAFVPTYASIGIWGAVLLDRAAHDPGHRRRRRMGRVGAAWRWNGRAPTTSAAWSRLGRNSACPAGCCCPTSRSSHSASGPGDEFLTWGWRVPFALSIVLVGVGLWIRLGIMETPVFQEVLDKEKTEKAPVLEVIKRQPKEIILSALLRMSEQAPFYVFTAFIFAYAVGTLHMSRDLILGAVMVAACVSFVTIPLSGHISDKIGRKNMYLIGVVTMGLFGFLYFGMVDTAIPSAVFIAIVLSLIPHDMQYGPQAALIAESFTPRLRYSGASLGYQLASIIAGGPAPLDRDLRCSRPITPAMRSRSISRPVR